MKNGKIKNEMTEKKRAGKTGIRKEKTRKSSIRVKILLPSCLLVTIICVLLGLVSYQSIKDGMVSMGVEGARMAAQIAMSVVDPDFLLALEPGCENTMEYRSQLAKMRAEKDKYGIAYLYTLYTDGSQVYYGVDTDESERQAEYGKPFEKSYADLKAAFEGEEIVQEYIESNAYGDVITIYQPIKNSKGEVVGVMGCDYDAKPVLDRLTKTTGQVLLIAVICEVLAIVMISIISGTICGNLGKVNGKIYDLVHNEGDLTQKLDIKSGDELELIAVNVNKLLEYIRGIMLNISSNSIQLNQSSQIVAGNLSDARMNILDVSDTMEQMSAAMEETSASINQVNESIGMIYEAMESISENAGSGRDTSNEVMEKAAMVHHMAVEEQEKANRQVQELAHEVNEKIERSRAVQQIDTLTNNIINITDQTNLLALNASIEAARAGEAGRGFAVVAGEIGNLATESAQTATQIQKVSADVIDAVNELAQNAQMMLTFMNETAMGGYEKLLETSESYRKDVAGMNDMMKQFAQESEEVKHSIDDIREVVAAVNIAVEESAKGAVNVTEMSVNLTNSVGDVGKEANSNMDIANQLTCEVNRFKLQ